MDKKSQWADEVLKSLEGIESAVPQNALFNKITAKIPENKEYRIIPLKHLGWAVAAASVVILINVYALRLQNDSLQNVKSNKEDHISLLTDYTF